MAESRIIEFVEERNESSLRFLEQRKESPLRPLDDRNESSLLRDRRCAFGVDSRSDYRSGACGWLAAAGRRAGRNGLRPWPRCSHAGSGPPARHR